MLGAIVDMSAVEDCAADEQAVNDSSIACVE